ncbi:hypothetical protein ABEB36_013340 [Hypothenemus hampei]|uniref:MSP domain-containing protein n=1 Tax=Hypothenemus hampei TaxID=57062 RepID=A0ABD1E7X1_HYPHA
MSKSLNNMDPLPQIPKSHDPNDTVSLITNKFKENLENEHFPEDIATSLRIYSIDDNLSLKELAKHILQVNRCLEEESSIIHNAETNIIQQHQNYIFQKSTIDKNRYLRETIKLKTCDIFNNLALPDKIWYGLIEKSDLYPDHIRRFLDYRFNPTLHRCKRCAYPEEKSIYKFSKITTEIRRKILPKNEPANYSRVFQIEPSPIIFKNFNADIVYKQTFKIKNLSFYMQKISIRTYPKSSDFNLIFDACQKIAPGMSAFGILKFSPKHFETILDEMSFLTRKGAVIKILIKCYRDPPILSVVILKSTDALEGIQCYPGTERFSVKRQCAVNDSIDFGSCFTAEHVLISLILYNHGNKANFFWLTEENFKYQKVNKASSDMELIIESFWLYPTYFQMLTEDICVINILFQPMNCGFQTQTLVLMCDNNNFRQIDLIGDAVCFNKYIVTIEVLNKTKEIEKLKNHCIFMGHVNEKENASFIMRITNKSSVFLKYYLHLSTKENVFDMSEWLDIKSLAQEILQPYSSCDIIFNTKCPRDIYKGYYNCKLRLFVKDVPIVSLGENEVFLISTNGRHLEEIIENVSVVDVLLNEIEVACFVDPTNQPEILQPISSKKCEKCGFENCQCGICLASTPLVDLKFNTCFLDFGLLPLGVNVEKDLQIINLSKQDLKWSVIELKYNIDIEPYTNILNELNITRNNGLVKASSEELIKYKIVDKSLGRNVSILVLFSIRENRDQFPLVAESICVVIYEIIKLDIVIQTGQSRGPILCPMQMLYTGVPIKISFQIHNNSLIPGCFYFLEPIGSDADKIHIEYEPKSGQLKACATKKIIVKLICYEVGILENVIIPCFIGKNEKPLELRLLCVVDCIHIFFYIPMKNRQFEKILWPPKVIYEYNSEWNNYCCLCEEPATECEEALKNIQSEHETNLSKISSETMNEIKHGTNVSLEEEIQDSVEEEDCQNILDTLKSEDTEIMLQDYVVEVSNVKTNELKKVTIYFENVTPKSAKYSIQATNFPAKETRRVSFNSKFHTTEEIWKPLIENYGIVIYPQTEGNYIRSHELVIVNIWIYAQTWGIYVEEIIIDIENIVSFSFSLIIDVVGCPLYLPSANRAITNYPTIRFGSVLYDSSELTKEVLIKNTSSIDVTASWHIFCLNEENCEKYPFNFICDVVDKKSEEKFEFDFTDIFLGNERFDFIQILPSKLTIKPDQQLSIPIVFSPKKIKSDKIRFPMRAFIVGRSYPGALDRVKSNYFYRKRTSMVIEVTATVEKPSITIEVEDPNIMIYANEVLIQRQNDFYIKFKLTNPTLSIIEMSLDCSEPLTLGKKDPKLVLEPGKCKEIRIPCIVTYEKILKWAEYVYENIKFDPTFETASTENISKKVHSLTLEKRDVDEENKILTLFRKLTVNYPGKFKEVIPIGIKIYYPNIIVKPTNVKFGYLLLGRTQKAIVSIYNLSGHMVLFEIYKTITTQEIFVTPANGEIEKRVGMNPSFINIAIYFTPKECKTYHESIRIVSNIPQYYIDIPINGAGSFNEKFK